MSEIVKATNTAVALPDDADPFQAFADAVAPQYIIGKLLKFSKGLWLAGETSEPVGQQLRLIAGMPALMTGWVRWREFKPVEHAMVSIGSRLLPPRREMLGDSDPSTWEVDDHGERKDPWQLTSYLPMVADESGEAYTFTASSKGALGALGKLSRTYAAHRRRQPAELPIVGLSSSGYQHPRREYGFIQTPVLTVLGWADISCFNEAMALAGYDFEGDGPAVVAVAKQASDMNDDIPF